MDLYEQVCREINQLKQHRDFSITNDTSKASSDFDGQWRFSQLSSKLQEIIQRNPENFAGDGPVNPDNYVESKVVGQTQLAQ